LSHWFELLLPCVFSVLDHLQGCKRYGVIVKQSILNFLSNKIQMYFSKHSYCF
jgi:hypothetical protein